MKKMFAVLCALLLVPTLALCDEIESIRSDVQSGLYDMEKINHAPIYIPDVSEINVIRAEKYEANPEIVQKYENAGMIAIEKMKKAILLYMGDEYDKKYGVDKRTQFLEYHIDSAWRLDDEELADIHAKNQPISAGEVVNKVKNMIRNAVQSGLYDTEKINHAPIYIPDVSEINVIRAEKYEANPEIVQKYENAGMIAIEKMKMATLLYMGDEYDKKYGVDKRTQFLEYHIDSAWKLDDEELDNIYAQKQPISAGTVVDKIKMMVHELYDESINIELKRIEVVSSFQKGKMVSTR